MPLVSICEVGKTYRRGGMFGRATKVAAVSDVSLELEKGRCLAVVGPSGSGKSTLGRLVLGLERPDSGTVLYKDEPLHSLRGKKAREARRNIQVVFQNSHGAVNPRFTVRDILAEPLRNFLNMRGTALTNAALHLLALVGLEPDLLMKLPHQCSGGELQRVCIARALAPEPEVIVLDEAVSSLDMLSQSLILELLMRIRKESGTTFLFISHDLRVVNAIADGMAVMSHGTLAAYAPDMSDPAQASKLLAAPAMRELAEAVLPKKPMEPIRL